MCVGTHSETPYISSNQNQKVHLINLPPLSPALSEQPALYMNVVPHPLPTGLRLQQQQQHSAVTTPMEQE
jgi:hypothetical protein